MDSMFVQVVSLVLVGILWGGTNPLIKKNSKDITKVKADGRLRQFLLELKYLATNLHYLIPMGLNQLGSVLYFLILQSTDLTLSVPLANSLTFVFTAIGGFMLGESLPNRNTISGIILVIIGTALCCLDKMGSVQEAL